MATRRKKPSVTEQEADAVVQAVSATTPPPLTNDDLIMKVILNQIGLDKQVEGKQIRVVERLYRSDELNYLAVIYASLEPFETRYAVYGIPDETYSLESNSGNLDRVKLTHCFNHVKFLADAGLIESHMWAIWKTDRMDEYNEARINGEDLYRFRSLLNIR